MQNLHIKKRVSV